MSILNFVCSWWSTVPLIKMLISYCQENCLLGKDRRVLHLLQFQMQKLLVTTMRWQSDILPILCWFRRRLSSNETLVTTLQIMHLRPEQTAAEVQRYPQYTLNKACATCNLQTVSWHRSAALHRYRCLWSRPDLQLTV